MNDTIKLQAQVPDELADLRLDQALAKLFPAYSRARLQAWIKAGYVKVNGDTLQPRNKIKAAQTVIIEARLETEEKWQAQAIPLNIVYEDEDLIIINKSANLVVHPGAGNKDNTLVNALLHYAPELVAIPRAGIVHRLDKGTSGLLMIARSLTAHHQLVQQIQKRIAKRGYQAIVNGILIAGGSIDAPIGRHPLHRTKMAITETGKTAMTHYRIIEKFRAHTFIKVQLETGRTHQIRVHMAHIHHPIVGDPQYGRLKLPANISIELKQALQHFKRQALHASHLEIQHPRTGKKISWEAPLPEDMQTLLKLLRKDV